MPGTVGAETIPLKFGPDLWHIPKAYGATFGSNQTQGTNVNGFNIFLKLPDLEPVLASDPSPLEIHGHGDYISISFSYDNRFGAIGGIKPTVAPDGHLTMPFERYVTQNKFINYEELTSNGLPDNAMYWSTGQVWFISNDTSSTSNSFPPQSFWCNAFYPGQSAGCELSVVKPPKSTVIGHYLISYSFSRDYFSQIASISSCMERLYNTFAAD